MVYHLSKARGLADGMSLIGVDLAEAYHEDKAASILLMHNAHDWALKFPDQARLTARLVWETSQVRS